MSNSGQLLEQLYREQSGKMLAFLVSLTGNLSLAEEIWHDTLETALPVWNRHPPDNPVAWLFKVARNKTIDRLRHQKMSLKKSRLLQAMAIQDEIRTDESWHELDFGDEQLKLIFACCHPALDIEKQIPLTLSVVCGLNTLQISDALVINKATLEQRLTRAKRKLKTACIPFLIPQPQQLQERLSAVLKTIYLVFNAADESALKNNGIDLASEALRLVAHLQNLLPGQPEVTGLRALMLFHFARRDARLDTNGNLILLEQQDRSLWDNRAIRYADIILKKALGEKQAGSYQIQAAIQGVHCLAASAEQTDWLHIEALYHLLMTVDSNPVIKLNAAVATSMSRDIEQALALILECECEPQLRQYSLLYGAKADMLNRLGDVTRAIKNYQKALSLTNKTSEISFYQEKLDRLSKKTQCEITQKIPLPKQ